MKWSALSLVVIFLCSFLLGGCGGSGGGSNSTGLGLTTPVSFSIGWGARSRATQGPSSALSVVLTLKGATLSGADFTVEQDRNTALAAYTTTYSSAASAMIGTFQLTVNFYDQAGGVGDVVATGQGLVTIQADGSGIGDVSVTNTVKSVSVNSSTVVTVGATAPTQLTFSAKDSSGGLVAVTPGSGKWAQLDGSGVMSLTADGLATAISAGTSDVTVTVDGLTSPSSAISVGATTSVDFLNPGFESPVLGSGVFQEPPTDSSTIWAGTFPWGIANGSGAWGTGAHAGSQYAFIQASTTFGLGALEQSIAGLQVGHRYQVTFWMARRNGNSSTFSNVGALVSASINGTQLFGPTAPSSDGTWLQYATTPIFAGSSNCDLKFLASLPSGTADATTLIDDVHLVALQ